MILRVTRVQYYKDCKPKVLPIRETTEPNLEKVKAKLGDKRFGLLMVTGTAQIIKPTPPKPDSKWTRKARRYIYELVEEK